MERPDVGVGSPAWLDLVRFGEMLHGVFGHTAYLVGSATRGRDFRDVDVRVILPDDEMESWFPNWLAKGHDERWNGVCVAFAYLGARNTGLNIDFQVQQQTNANELYGEEIRMPLVWLRPTREESKDDA